jgi:hypothetical protein
MGQSLSSDSIEGEVVQPDSSLMPTAVGSNWTSEYCGGVNGAADGPPLAPGSGYLAINGSEDLSNCIMGNSGARVYTIYTGREAYSYYEYVIWVDAQGPKGSGSGNMWLTFEDQSPDHYRLKIHDSTRKWHYVRYNSDKPNLIHLIWSVEKP